MTAVAYKQDTQSKPSLNFLCPACQSVSNLKTYSIPDHEYGLDFIADYVECSRCGTLSQYPMPSFKELAAFYPDSYHSFHNNNLIVRAKNALRLSHLRSLLFSETGVVLDYGCGDGSFLVEAAKVLPQTFYGYEIGDKYEKQIYQDGRVVIIKGEPQDLFKELPPCQLITLNHVIEHLPSPIETITALTSFLIDGGKIEGQTPGADSLERAVFGSRWSGFHAPRHTVIFSRSGLKVLLERAGLSDATVTGAFNPAGIAISIASVPYSGASRIHRSGLKWLFCLGLATLLYPIDLLSGKPGIINFTARKNGKN